ncbi:MAG TPA: DUF3299 domain-containing protein [Burkholderiales bacterium]|nr:DUF3299 domain-containing protein [Burkholderiales bacterium]
MTYLLALLAMIAAPLVAAQPGSPAAGGPYQEISWEALVPKEWDPARHFRNIDLGSLKDGDPKAMEVLEIMKREWANAPIDPSFNGRKVRIPGYVVPIEEKERAITEFLLVPYYGACIHVPPPPANQIIHVISAKPIKNLRVMDLVWVAGEIKAARYSANTPMGLSAAGYQINSVAVTAYKEPMKK